MNTAHASHLCSTRTHAHTQARLEHGGADGAHPIMIAIKQSRLLIGNQRAISPLQLHTHAIMMVIAPSHLHTHGATSAIPDSRETDSPGKVFPGNVLECHLNRGAFEFK